MTKHYSHSITKCILSPKSKGKGTTFLTSSSSCLSRSSYFIPSFYPLPLLLSFPFLSSSVYTNAAEQISSRFPGFPKEIFDNSRFSLTFIQHWTFQSAYSSCSLDCRFKLGRSWNIIRTVFTQISATQTKVILYICLTARAATYATMEILVHWKIFLEDLWNFSFFFKISRSSSSCRHWMPWCGSSKTLHSLEKHCVNSSSEVCMEP